MISVVIPVYNGARYLHRCLNSVLASSYRDFELILVNDGSTDGTLQICQEYAARDRRIRLISQENAGVSAARNRGLTACRGEWVVFVDADDLISPDFLGLIAREEGQDLLLFDFACTVEELTATKPIPAVRHFGREDVPELLRALIVRLPLVEGGNLNFASPWAKAYRRTLLDRCGIQFSPELFYGEDRLFNAEFLICADRCTYIPTLVYCYSFHPDSSSHRFNPRLPHNLVRLLEQLRDTLETSGMFVPLERDFYSYALDNLSYTMVWSVFCPENPGSCGEKRQACRHLLDNDLYHAAMKYNRSTGHWVRKTLLWLIQLRWYFAAGLLARLWHGCLSWKNRRKMGI